MDLGSICVDSHAINKITMKFDMMSKATIFSKIDLKSGFLRIRICSGDEWKTVFKTEDDYMGGL